MDVGDIVRLRPEPWRKRNRLAIVTDEAQHNWIPIQWLGDNHRERVGRQHLEVISEGR